MEAPCDMYSFRTLKIKLQRDGGSRIAIIKYIDTQENQSFCEFLQLKCL